MNNWTKKAMQNLLDKFQFTINEFFYPGTFPARIGFLLVTYSLNINKCQRIYFYWSQDQSWPFPMDSCHLQDYSREKRFSFTILKLKFQYCKKDAWSQYVGFMHVNNKCQLFKRNLCRLQIKLSKTLPSCLCRILWIMSPLLKPKNAVAFEF